MIKKSFLLLSIMMTLLVAQNIDKKIKNTKNNLNSNIQKENSIKKSLSELQVKIEQYKTTLDKIKKSIKNLESDITTYKQKSSISTKKLNRIKAIYDKLNTSQKKVNKKLVNLLSKYIYLAILLDNSHTINSQDKLINSYIYKTYSNVLRDKFNKTKVKFFKLKLDLALVKSELVKIDTKIKSLQEKKSELKKLNVAKRDGMHKLLVATNSYKKKLRQVRKENRHLQSLLRKLKILKRKDEEEKETITLKPSKSSSELNVRRVGNSYSRTPVAKYRGAKTIAPFKRYKVVRRFGNFTDPTYNIKMFNPNVILKPLGSKNVINVLDGKVISITNTPAIGNIIIVENHDGLHTLYAKVSSIPSSIKVGRVIKKGYILGKVKSELYFEVTKDSKNINPMRLIR